MPLVTVSELAVRLRTAASGRKGTRVIALDGRSGAGKTTLAEALAPELGHAPVVHMDDLYPGWDGLEAAVPRLVAQVLEPLTEARPARWQRYDWTSGTYSGWHEVPASPVVLVEGVGSGAPECSDHLAALVWVQADPATRFRRAMQRDGDAYAPHWQRWAAQEERYVLRSNGPARADLVVDTSPQGAPGGHAGRAGAPGVVRVLGPG